MLREPQVALVARDFEDRAIARVQRDLDGPRAREDRRVLDRGLIHDRVGCRAREALDDAQVLVAQAVQPADAEAALLVELEVARLDDERVALEPAARVADPLRDGRRSVRPAVERDDARLVVHLDEDHDVIGRLEDAVVVVVRLGQHRRRGAEHDAALREPAIRRPVGRVRGHVGGALLDGGLRRRRQRGDAAVARLDDERSAPGSDAARAALEEDVVVGADVAGAQAGGRRSSRRGVAPRTPRARRACRTLSRRAPRAVAAASASRSSTSLAGRDGPTGFAAWRLVPPRCRPPKQSAIDDSQGSALHDGVLLSAARCAAPRLRPRR